MLSYLRSVDTVIVIDEARIAKILKILRPDVWYTVRDTWRKGGHRRPPDAVAARSLGCKIIRCDRYEPYISSSQLVERLAENKLLGVMSSVLKGSIGNFNYSDSGPIKISSQVPRNLLGLAFKGEICSSNNLAKLKEKCVARGQKVVFTAGTFDLIHVGHARYFEKAKSLGDILVVGLPSNESVRRLKGDGRPILDELARAETLTYLRSIDYVVIFDDPTVLQCLKSLKPEVFFTVDEIWNSGLTKSPEYKAVTKYGGSVSLAPRQSPYLSASLIINKAAGNRVREIFRECLTAVARKGSLKESPYNS